MGISGFIGKRYIATTKGKGFVSFISIISVLGIAIGIMAVIVVLSVMNGVTSEVRDKILSMTAHAQVVSTSGQLTREEDINQYIDGNDQIINTAPYIEGRATIPSGQNFLGISLKGIDPSQEIGVSDALLAISDEVGALTPNRFNILIGKELAINLGVGIGDKISVVVPKISVSATGFVPRIKRFTVAGIFESGHYLYDSAQVFAHLDDVAKLLQRGDAIDGYQLKLKDMLISDKVAKKLNQQLPLGLKAFDWTAQNKSYFETVQIEKAAMSFILMIIVMVAAFNILSTLVMVVKDKYRDIAILRTIGVSPSQIMRIFIIQGVILGVIGTILGVISGILVSKQVPNIMIFLESQFGIRLPPELYFISSLNPEINTSFVILISVTSVILSFLATLYPAYKAANVQPARALSYE